MRMRWEKTTIRKHKQDRLNLMRKSTLNLTINHHHHHRQQQQQQANERRERRSLLLLVEIQFLAKKIHTIYQTKTKNSTSSCYQPLRYFPLSLLPSHTLTSHHLIILHACVCILRLRTTSTIHATHTSTAIISC